MSDVTFPMTAPDPVTAERIKPGQLPSEAAACALQSTAQGPLIRPSATFSPSGDGAVAAPQLSPTPGERMPDRAGEGACAAEPAKPAKAGSAKPRPLTEADAVEIWIARWLRMRPKDMMVRFGCDSRRLYDIWWGQAFPGSKVRAKRTFIERYPGAADRTDFGYRKIPRGGSDPRQGTLF